MLARILLLQNVKTKRTKTKDLCKISTADLHKTTTTITNMNKKKQHTTYNTN